MGRPRSELAHLKVLEAAGRLFAEHGIDGTSMDAIAEASGVSKATIYKHWPDKPALCLEVVSHLHASEPQPALQVTDDVRGDIVAFLDRTPTRPRSDVRSRMMPHVWAYAVRTPEFGEVWRRRYLTEMKMHCVPQDEVADLVREGGCVLVEAEHHVMDGGFQSRMYWVVRPAPDHRNSNFGEGAGGK